MTDVAIDTLRLRGPGARRLTRVAAGPLPRALERALADVGDVVLDRVVVALDLDVEAYDDETIALLWADAIRTGVLGALGTARSTPAPVPREPGDPAPRPLVGTAGLLATLRSWLAADTAALPRALLALGEPEVAGAVAAAAGPHEWNRVLAALARSVRLPPGPGTDGGAAAPPRDVSGPGLPADPRTEPSGPEGAPGPAVTAPPPRPTPGVRPAADRAALVGQALAELGPLVGDSPAPIEPDSLTRAAGLVLLYPWLADHCRRAEDLHPGLDPLDVREAALAALLDPQGTWVDDPLVGFLAGRAGPGERRTPWALPHADEVAGSADRVLASFAALLPGFERSSPDFVRESWVLRLGVLDRDRDPVLLSAATHPLDVLLPLLPYPVGLVKLPWSRPLSVRFRP